MALRYPFIRNIAESFWLLRFKRSPFFCFIFYRRGKKKPGKFYQDIKGDKLSSMFLGLAAYMTGFAGGRCSCTAAESGFA